MSATTPAPTSDGCRRDQARSRSAGVGRRARIGRPSRNRCEVVGELLGRPVAVGRILAQCLQYDRLQLARHRAVQVARWNRIVLRDLADERVAVAALEGRAQGQQLVECRAQRVDVATVVDDSAAGKDLLGACVA